MDYWRTSIAQEKEQLHRLWDRCAAAPRRLPRGRLGGLLRQARPCTVLLAALRQACMPADSSTLSLPTPPLPRSLSYINECTKRARRDIADLQQRKAALEQATRWRPNVRRT